MKQEAGSFGKVKPNPALSKPLVLPTIAALYMVANTNLWSPVSAQTINNPPIKSTRRMDMSKSAIEIPLKRLIKSENTPLAPRIPDISKMRIEAPVKSMMSPAAAPDLFKTMETRALLNLSDKPDDVTPKDISVQTKLKTTVSKDGAETGAITHAPAVVAPMAKVKPGLVNWHKDITDATNHSAKSGKPVLVFHMMGSMDDRFC